MLLQHLLLSLVHRDDQVYFFQRFLFIKQTHRSKHKWIQIGKSIVKVSKTSLDRINININSLKIEIHPPLGENARLNTIHQRQTRNDEDQNLIRQGRQRCFWLSARIHFFKRNVEISKHRYVYRYEISNGLYIYYTYRIVGFGQIRIHHKSAITMYVLLK